MKISNVLNKYDVTKLDIENNWKSMRVKTAAKNMLMYNSVNGMDLSAIEKAILLVRYGYEI